MSDRLTVVKVGVKKEHLISHMNKCKPTQETPGTICLLCRSKKHNPRFTGQVRACSINV